LITPPAPGPPVPPAPFVSPVQPLFLESGQIATALRLGWYFTELRGRHDEAVFRNPRPPVVEDEDSLCLGDERTREEQAAEVAADVLGADQHADAAAEEVEREAGGELVRAAPDHEEREQSGFVVGAHGSLSGEEHHAVLSPMKMQRRGSGGQRDESLLGIAKRFHGLRRKMPPLWNNICNNHVS